MDIKYLRKYGCDYLKNSSLWDSLDSYEAWKADARNNLTARPPYWLGRNLCVRGRGHKPLSLFCPEACGCHRGDQDCPLMCPERDATTPECPAHQQQNFMREGSESSSYLCPRRPHAHAFDVGVPAQDARVDSFLPPQNCAVASTGACLDMSTGKTPLIGCCSRCGDGGCAPGYTYAGQFVTSLEMVSSTYPDFFPFCGYAPNCGNTCCVPSDEWDGAWAAGD